MQAYGHSVKNLVESLQPNYRSNRRMASGSRYGVDMGFWPQSATSMADAQFP
jgi:hypothetical protein